MAANRILAHHGVLNAYGHISARDPDDAEAFYLSRSLSASQVGEGDIMRFDLEGDAMADDRRAPYVERFIHAAIYAARPDVHCVLHAHTEEILPFTITSEPFRAVIRSVSDIGVEVPRWDIRTGFGDATNLLVSTIEHGRDLAATLGGHSMVLMRGHGFTSCGPSVLRTVSTAVNLPRNARVLLAARQMRGPVVAMSAAEMASVSGVSGRDLGPDSPAARRGWNLWLAEVGLDGAE
ncbi:class II aldolase/adducin family protein [Catenulispora pinisilvae]|uniref:class II aldolase/adducin family protein n=1 Tax=Catenulispora pinisilvae TaxID=2705253 RepID=UPI0018917D62|nr:class II aldolase/adducin family protein [Catenulispora pinisilvae]